MLNFKHIENDWVYVFHLRDPRTGFESGEALTIFTNDFLICTDETIGKTLVKERDRWLNRKVNMYLSITDRGLTPNLNVGYVTKVELVNGKGQVVETIPDNL